jgi:hypothetical protein
MIPEHTDTPYMQSMVCADENAHPRHNRNVQTKQQHNTTKVHLPTLNIQPMYKTQGDKHMPKNTCACRLHTVKLILTAILTCTALRNLIQQLTAEYQLLHRKLSASCRPKQD